MLFSSLIFLTCFLPAVIFIYYTVCRVSRTLQNIFLLIVSLGFYAWGEPRFVFILMGSILANWGFGLAIDKVRKNRKQVRLVTAAMLVFNLSIIFVFKYLMFTLKNIKAVTGFGFAVPKIALPIGISFFTFQAISYVIDIYREKGKAQKNPLNVGLYIAFFPQLIAGPIVRYETVAEQIKNRRETLNGFTMGVNRFLIGFAKKVLLANNFALVADKAFKLMQHDQLSTGMAWLGIICYTLQIYYDFSGYSDMAIGLGRMFGFKFNENFNYPYISKSTTEFWRRWHISLGTWFRDYVYIPLGGNRLGKRRMYINTFIVWLLTGLWHGANWTFICWGLMYFVTITAEKYTGLDRATKLRRIRHVYTMFLVMMGWVLFRADNIGDAFSYYKVLFGQGSFGHTDANFYVVGQEYIAFLILGILFMRPFAKKLYKTKLAKFRFSGAAYTLGLMVLFLAGIAYLVKGAYNPFIYFNF